MVTSSYEWNPKQTNRSRKISSVWNADLWLGSHIWKIAPIKMETKQHNNKWDFPFKKDNLNDNKIYKTWFKSWHKYLWYVLIYKSQKIIFCVLEWTSLTFCFQQQNAKPFWYFLNQLSYSGDCLLRDSIR